MSLLADNKLLVDMLLEHPEFGQPTAIMPFHKERFENNKIYPIDLDTRIIHGPKPPDFLGVQHDHQSDVIYFSVPRYYNGIDLSKTIAVV